MKLFQDQRHTKTDDIGYLVQIISRNLLPYFFVISGVGVIWVGASLKNAIAADSRNTILNIGGGLTAAGLAVSNPQESKREENYVVNENIEKTEGL